MKKLFLFLLFISAFKFIGAQTIKQSSQAQMELVRRGEVYFSFQVEDRSKLQSLTKIISISNVKGNTVYAYANQKEFADFSAYNYEYKVLTAPGELNTVQMSDNQQQVLTWNYYPTYTAYEALMQQFATDHPQICKLITIASLASGRKILALRISDNVNVEENEPELLYTSSIHGDELTGYILMLHLADSLLNGYGTNSRITHLVNDFDIVICPLANPDGTYKGGNSTVNGATRTNANNVDLNRNYPDPENGAHPDGNAWQPETVAFMNFASQNTFTMSVNFHGGSEVVNYPWDTWSKTSADNEWWIYVSREYADTAHKYSPSGYMTLMDNGVTDGYAWYEVNGGRQDYMNYYQHCREATIELSDTKTLLTSELLNYWNYNRNSLLNYIEESGYGLRGLITDSVTGEPLLAKVYISGFDKDSSFIYSDAQVGDYHRLLKAGNYTVTFSSSGYLAQTYTVQVADKKANVLDVKLVSKSLGTNIDEEANAQSGISIFPNPVVNSQVTIESKNVIQSVIVKDAVGRIIFSSAPTLKQIIIQNNWPSGIYLVQLKIEGKWISKKIQVTKN